MLGPSLLVAPVVEPGVAARAVYLPGGSRWFDIWTGEVFEGGQTVARRAPFDRPPLLAREGSIIALNAAEQHFSARTDKRAFQIFPVANGKFENEIFEDDGETENYRKGRFCRWTIRVACTAAGVNIVVTAQENGVAIACDPEIILPATEYRAVTIAGGRMG